MRYWWVNHKKTFRQEFPGGYVWCPKRQAGGRRSHFYESVREVCPDDILISYAFAKVQGYGIATTYCYSCPRPDEFGKVGDAWYRRGWRADINFTAFPQPLRTAEHASTIAPLLPQKYSPLKANGLGNESYFTGISKELALLVLQLADPSAYRLVAGLVVSEDNEIYIDDGLPVITEWEDRQQELLARQDGFNETMREALVQARWGQGLFRREVARFEICCRITKVDNPAHLIASHIKPWRDSDNEERLIAGNGLMLTPSIDHLFDRGFISFENSGDLIVSPVADGTSMKRMGVDTDNPPQARAFNTDQKHFLDFHRREILLLPGA